MVAEAAEIFCQATLLGHSVSSCVAKEISEWSSMGRNGEKIGEGRSYAAADIRADSPRPICKSERQQLFASHIRFLGTAAGDELRSRSNGEAGVDGMKI